MHEPMSEIPVLETHDVSLSFGGLSVLRGISLAVQPGEVVALIGPNGAGKTAFFNCISGVFRASTGSTISLLGKRIEHLPTYSRNALGLTRTFQHAHLVGEMTALENILLGLAPAFSGGLASLLMLPIRSFAEERSLTERAFAMLDLCGAADFAHMQADALPLGIRRRVDLARALVGEPKLLLLDEPSSGLSREERALVPELIDITQTQRSLGIVWIEHDLDLVMSKADRITVLHHGQIIYNNAVDGPDDRASAIHAYMNGSA